MTYVFSPSPVPALSVRAIAAEFPVHRIYCIGRNYGAHVKEMGRDPDRDPPIFFCKPADALRPRGGSLRADTATVDFQPEVELVVALERGGSNLTPAAAEACIYGYAVGFDMTRRDHVMNARQRGTPWEIGKAFDDSAPCGEIVPRAEIHLASHTALRLFVNGQIRQQGTIGEMIWSVGELLAQLSQFFELRAGDLIFTGTPAGVAPVVAGDVLRGEISGLPDLVVNITP